ncbi:uncharacterized protein LOC124454223 [Xenia sp. Carnegie-2017]|uniref:uncharacterized protein LOC124454223 n=1 Tax=Xenia sp. Carnegie-2017 TaxID=2897299 RepID=UPI001F038E6D|nr:uncharacterized protein LOC124454223 [Xenia sp. Carnegie-2017]
MIGIDKEDRDMLRFLWLRDTRDPHSEVLKLRFCRLVFGLRPSPAILGATINHHLKTHEKQEPEPVEHLKNSLYVDDFVSSAETDETALQIYKGTKQLMAKGGFNLRKWSSNSSNVVKCIEALEVDNCKESLLTDPTQVKVLRMVWDTVEDTFLFNLTEIIDYANSLPVTKRSLLKWSSKIFDLLGFLSPFTIRLKILFQIMCFDRLGWDCELHGNRREQWNVLLSELRFRNDVRVPRKYYLFQPKYYTTQVNGFSGASESAIGAVVYVRTVYENGTIDVKLIASKTKVAPVKKQMIPRLELVAATVLEKFTLTRYFWANSSSWLNGPKFLARDEEEWPKRPVGNLSQSEEVLREIVKEHPNVVRSLVSNEIEQRAMPDLNKAIDIARYSSTNKLLRITAYVMRFINILKKMPRCERTTNKLITSEEPSSDEIRKVKLLWIRSIQQLSLEKEILFLPSKNANSSIPIYVKQFGPFLDDDHVLQCRRRLKNSSLNLESKNPVLLPK